VQFKLCAVNRSSAFHAHQKIVTGASISVRPEHHLPAGRLAPAEIFTDSIKAVGITPAGPDAEKLDLGGASDERAHETHQAHDNDRQTARHSAMLLANPRIDKHRDWRSARSDWVGRGLLRSAPRRSAE